jgi:tRNA G18 (ribose-2'-O)-methylase SpoU
MTGSAPNNLPLIRIEDVDDPRMAVYRDLRDKDLRRLHGALYIAESEMVVRQVLRTPARLHSVLVVEQRLHRLIDLLELLPAGVPIYLCSKAVAESIAGLHIHRGMLAAGYRPDAAALSLEGALGHLRDRKRFCLVLAEGISDVDNMGSIFRNAAAFGADGLVLAPSCCDPLYRKAIRTSVGHALTLPFARSLDWLADLRRLREEWGLTLIAAETVAGAVPVREAPRAARLGLLVGAEGPGVEPESLALCDAVCEIPMVAEAASLNVAAATAVMLYELIGRG